MDYWLIKTIHQAAVVFSITGFFIRGLASLAGKKWVQSRWARTIPHGVDTVLLLSAITLAFMLRISPLSAPWLMAKVIGLMVYIGLGVVALRPRVGVITRAGSWIGALVTVGWIASVAITKNPLGFISLLP
jgi:uncharacterized membrane protein SirB2